MGIKASLTITEVVRVYPGSKGYDRCLCLVEGQIGRNGTSTTERVFIVCRRGELPEGHVDLSATVSLAIRRPSADYPTPELSVFLVSTLMRSA